MKFAKKSLLVQTNKLLTGVCFFLMLSTVVPCILFANTAEKNIGDSGCNEISQEIFEELQKNGQIDRMVYKESNLKPILCPESELSSFVRDVWTSDEEVVFISESLFYLPKEKNIGINEIPVISKIIRSVSTMEGIEYYSNSNEKTEVLYEKSYTVDNPESLKKIPDNTDDFSEKLSMYVYQEDNSFGKTIYEANIRQTENEIAMVLHNVKPIKFGFINAVKKDNLTTSFYFIDKGEYILTYIYSQVRFPALAIFESKVNESFRARIDALYSWFINSYKQYNN